MPPMPGVELMGVDPIYMPPDMSTGSLSPQEEGSAQTANAQGLLDQQEKCQTAQMLLDQVFNQEKTTATALLDISSSWMSVAWQGMIALLCIIPGASAFVVPFLFWKCGWTKKHLWPNNCLPRFVEAEKWFMLLLSSCIVDPLFVFSCWEASKEGVNLRAIVEQIQLRQISDILTLGSMLLWRILSIHIIQVSVQVHWHKCHAQRNLFRDPESDQKAILEAFVLKFADYWKISDPPTNFGIVDKWEAVRGFDRVIIVSSSVVMFLGMFLLQLRVNPRAEAAERLQTTMQRDTSLGLSTGLLQGESWLRLVTVGVVSIQSSLSWFLTVARIFSSALKMQKNRKQLLIFSYMSSQSIEYLSASDRTVLKEVLDEASMKLVDEDMHLDFNRSHNGVECNGNKSDVFAKLNLGNVKNVKDIETWWALRRYIQIDFKDESAIMDACGVIVFLLILAFLFSGVVEWSLRGDPLSLGFLLICALCFTLTFAMFRAFEACIEINNVLDRDALLLSDALLDVARQNETSPEVFIALQAVERRLSKYDDKQRLLGLTVTANLRNGWVASLAVAFFSWGSRFMAPVLSQLDIDQLQQTLLQAGLLGMSEKQD